MAKYFYNVARVEYNNLIVVDSEGNATSFMFKELEEPKVSLIFKYTCVDDNADYKMVEDELIVKCLDKIFALNQERADDYRSSESNRKGFVIGKHHECFYSSEFFLVPVNENEKLKTEVDKLKELMRLLSVK